MPIDIERYQKLKKKADAARTKMERTRGRRQELIKTVKEQYGCDSQKQLNAEIEKAEKELAEREAAFDTALEAYENEFAERGLDD
jgi:predicted Mrr-cat superfamily restriction endonuclease